MKRNMKLLSGLLLTLLLTFGVNTFGINTFGVNSSLAAPAAQAEQTIFDIITEDARFTLLNGAIEAANLAETLSGEESFTLFAPTDAAFDKLPESAQAALFGDDPLLTNVIQYHIAPERLTSQEIDALATVDTLLGRPLAVVNSEPVFIVNQAQVIETDIEATNGVIHVVDSVLFPPGVKGTIMTDAADQMLGITAPTLRDNLNIMENISQSDDFTQLTLALQATDLAEAFAESGPFTVFAPVDAAFEKLPDGTFDNLLANPAALEDLLAYHIVPDELNPEEIINSDLITAVSGQPIDVIFEADQFRIGDALVSDSFLQAENGLIYTIDTVLTPPQGALPESAVVVEENVVVCASDYVVQADDWLSKIANKFYGDPLAYPVIFEATNAFAKTNEAYDPIADPNRIEAGQRLCIPEQDTAEELVFGESALTNELTPQPITDLLMEDERFSMLTTAIETAGLADTLRGEGPFTLFAPTDAAFEKLPENVLNDLLNDPQELEALLLNHVAPFELMANDLVGLETITTARDDTINVTAEGDDVQIGGAQITTPDIQAFNGVIHAIDTVLLSAEE